MAMPCVKDALKLLSSRIEQPARRAFLQRSLTLGGLSHAERLHHHRRATASRLRWRRISRFNDRVQGWLFDPNATGADLPGVDDHAAVPVQRLLRRGRDPRGRRRQPTGSK